MYDVFLLSYDEPNADLSYNRLKALNPLARRVHGIQGIQEGHRKCAELTRTKHFFVVDADNRLDDARPFAYQVSQYDAGYVHLWYARNPLNGLTYGWGGLKLFPTALFEEVGDMRLDMTTSFPLKIIPEAISTTEFNDSAFSTWRAAFRECVKLTLAEQTKETRMRLHGWCYYARGRFAEECLKGARAGKAYAEEHRNDLDALLRINDYDWLQSRFS